MNKKSTQQAQKPTHLATGNWGNFPTALKLLLSSFLVLFFVVSSFAQFTTTSTPTNPYCIGASTGSITLTASTGTAPYTVQMTSPSLGSVITMSGSPASYTYTGLAAGTYSFKITDGGGSVVNRTITLTNPSPFSFTILAFPGSRGAATCDSIDAGFVYYTNGGTARPNYKYEFWVNAPSGTANGSVPAGSPTITYSNVATLGGTFRIPRPAQNALTVVRVTDSCGNNFAANVTAFANISTSQGNSATTACGTKDVSVVFNGLKVPVTITLDSAGTTKATNTITAYNGANGNSNANDGGTFYSVKPGSYTVYATDSCGTIFSTAVAVANVTKSFPNQVGTCNANNSVDSTGYFLSDISSFSAPFTLTFLSGPASYNHTNTAGVLQTNFTYPISRTYSTNPGNLELSNMPIGVYKIQVQDKCGYVDTATYSVTAANISKINLSATVTPGCLDANTVTVNGDFSCYRPQMSIRLTNASGTTLNSTGVTTNPISFSTYNLPSGNYDINFFGTRINYWATGTAATDASFIQHISANGASAKIPVSFAPYTGPTISVILKSPCPNSPVGSLVAKAVGVPPYNYELLAPLSNTVLRTSQTDSVFNNVNLSDSFRVRVTDACGNQKVTSIVSFAGVQRNVTINNSASVVSCVAIGAAATFAADSIDAFTYQWSGPNGFTATGRIVNKSITSITDAGSYKVVGTNIAGCKDSATIALTVKAIAGADQTVSCYYNGSATMAGSGTGTWTAQAGNPGTATISTPSSATTTITGFSAPGTYKFIFNNAAGCPDTATVVANNSCTGCLIAGNTVTTPATTSFCISASAVAISGSAPTPTGGVYKWIQSVNAGAYSTATGTSNTQNYTTGTLSAGTYSFKRVYTTTTPTACSDTSAAVTITVNAKPDAGIDQAAACYLTSTATMAAVGTGTWSAAAGNPGTATIATAVSATTNISGFSAAGTYKFVWTNAAGCTDTANVVVGSSCSCPIAADSIITINSTQCAPYSGTINGSTATPSSVTYQWQVSLNGGAFANATGTSTSEDYAVANLAAGTYQFRRVTSYVGTPSCTHITDTVTIVVNGKPNAGTNISSICGGSTQVLSGTPSGGAWSAQSGNPAGATVAGSNAIFANTASGTYNFIYTQTGCTDTVAVSVQPKPNAGANHFFECGTQPLTDTLVGTPAGGIWSALGSNATGTTLTGNVVSLPAAPAQGTWSFVYTSPNGCTDTMNVSIGVNGVPSLVVNMGNNPICYNGSVQLCPNPWGWSNYQWYKNGVAVAAPTGTGACITLDSTSIGSYTLKATNGAGCWSAASAATVVTYNRNCSTTPFSANTNSVYLNTDSAVAKSGTAQLQPQGGIAPYSYRNTTASGATRTSSNRSGTVSVNATTGAYTYTPATGFTGIDSFYITTCDNSTPQNCATQLYIVTVNGSTPVAPFWANANPAYVNTDSATAVTNNAASTLAPSGGTAPYTYSSVNAAGTASTSSKKGGTVSINPTTGVYTYTPAAGFIGVDTFYIKVCDASVPANCVTQMFIANVNSSSVTSGGGGGVESKTIGDVIAVRLFGNAINSKTEVDGITSGIKFTHSGVIVNGTNNLTLNDLVPATVTGTDAPYVSTPTDLVNFTNAVEILSVDYTKNNNVKAVAFATKTLGDVYSHTKPICDRLKGAELLEVKNINVNGYNLMAYKVRQRTGQTEYAMNLSAGTASNRNTISLQSNWFTNSYVADENLYNFQLWAVSYDVVKSMAADVISKLQANGNIFIPSATIADLPKAYISKGSRKATDLTVTVQNNTNNTNGYFELKEKANELMDDAQITVRQVPFTVAANGTTNVTIPVSDNYEGSIYVYLNNKLTDLVYLSDGTWSIDYNKNNTTIQQFNITNETPNNLTPNTNEHRLLRNVEVAATTKDYVSIYKTMMGGGIEQNVAAYNSLMFNANTMGAGSVKITLVKKSITNWNDQYSYTANIGDSKDFAIALNSFKSSKFATAINANDITAVNFSFITGRNTATNMTVNLSKVRFSTAAANTPASETLNVMNVYPNPTMGRFTTTFTSNAVQPLVLKVTDVATGRIVKTQFINATKGENKTNVSIDNNQAITNGLYILTLQGDDTKYTPVKLVIAKP